MLAPSVNTVDRKFHQHCSIRIHESRLVESFTFPAKLTAYRGVPITFHRLEILDWLLRAAAVHPRRQVVLFHDAHFNDVAGMRMADQAHGVDLDSVV